MNLTQRIMKRLGVLLLAICRTVYCWMFFFTSLFMFHFVYTSIRSMLHSHRVTEGDIVSTGMMATYALVFDITWWLFVRGKPAFKKWVMAANLICILPHLPAGIVYWNWRGFLEAERGVLGLISVGIVGIIIFSIPYHGWRHKPQIPVNCVSQADSVDLGQ